VLQVLARQREWSVVPPKPPQGFSDYLMVRGNYILAGGAGAGGNGRLVIPQPSPPPASLQDTPAAIRELFIQQERQRYRTRLQHKIERVSGGRQLTTMLVIVAFPIQNYFFITNQP
jgi:hypothetical protein